MYGNWQETQLVLDLHQMSTAEARAWLDARISRAPREVTQVLVIHGYRGGTALQTMVRKQYRHPRVKQKLLGLNPGETILVLQKPVKR